MQKILLCPVGQTPIVVFLVKSLNHGTKENNVELFQKLTNLLIIFQKLNM